MMKGKKIWKFMDLQNRCISEWKKKDGITKKDDE